MNLSSDKLHKQNLSYSIQGSYNSITLSIMQLSIPKYKKKGYFQVLLCYRWDTANLLKAESICLEINGTERW